MPDFPGAEVTNAISKIISSVIPPNTHVFLVALMPGLFFELSILVANPSVFCELFEMAREGSGLGKYALWGIAFFFAFVVGTAFILFVTLVQRLMGYVYRVWAVLREWLFVWPLYRLTTWLRQKPRWVRNRWLNNLFNYMHARVWGRAQDEGARRLWAVFAKRLMKEKYRIGREEQHLEQPEWNALYQTLGTLRIEDLRGAMTMVVFEATGWCGLAAMRFAPTLRNRSYLALSGLFIVAGLLHDWYVAANLNSPLFLAYLKIRALIREFPGLEAQWKQSQLPNPKQDAAKEENDDD